MAEKGRQYSVVVATRGSEDALRYITKNIIPACIDAPTILVLNREITEDLSVVLDEARDWHSGIEIQFCHGGGVARARNYGLHCSKTDLIVFLDDDVIPSRAAIDRLVDCLCDASTGVVTGRVLPVPVASQTGRLCCELIGLDRGGVNRSFGPTYDTLPNPLEAWELGVGAAFAVRRSKLLETSHPPIFDETLSNGQFCGGSEDVDFFFQCILAGSDLRYCADAVFLHAYPDSVRTFGRKMLDYSRADGAFYCKWRNRIRFFDVIRDLHGWQKRLRVQLSAWILGKPHLPIIPLLLEPLYKAEGALWWRYFVK